MKNRNRTQPTNNEAHRRLPLRTVVGFVIAAPAMLASTTTISALSRYVATKSVAVKDCIVTAGAKYDGANGWAIGAATAPCTARRSSTKISVQDPAQWYSPGPC